MKKYLKAKHADTSLEFFINTNNIKELILAISGSEYWFWLEKQEAQQFINELQELVNKME